MSLISIINFPYFCILLVDHSLSSERATPSPEGLSHPLSPGKGFRIIVGRGLCSWIWLYSAIILCSFDKYSGRDKPPDASWTVTGGTPAAPILVTSHNLI